MTQKGCEGEFEHMIGFAFLLEMSRTRRFSEQYFSNFWGNNFTDRVQ